nr:PREDICTED: uncharacterized protein LOC109633059 [Paralichthys olivaceus]
MKNCNHKYAACNYKSGTECQPCAVGSFTTDQNLEDSCERCFGDCRPDYHLKVVQKCTSTSDLKCVCEDGYKCARNVPYSENCGFCVKIQQTTTDEPTGNHEQTPSVIPSGSSSSYAKLCPSSKCDRQSVPSTPSTDVKSSQLAAILSPVVVVGCVALMILFCVQQPRHDTCFKRAVAELFNERRQVSASCKSKESSHQFPKDSFRAKQQPPPLAEANLGPVYVQNPGTVIFSFLSQFTGQVGSTTASGKAAERVDNEEDEERDSPVCHPTSSPIIHLSEEERTGEMENIFFPSQEQGKDCHVSKEEEEEL